MDDSKLHSGLQKTADQYEFAELSSSDLAELNKVQNNLSQNQQKKIILLAYEQK